MRPRARPRRGMPVATNASYCDTSTRVMTFLASFEVILGQLKNTIPQAAAAKAEEFYDLSVR